MTTKQKWAYFWDYYKIHVLAAAALLAAAVSLIHHYVTYKDYGFYAAFVNAGITDPSENPTEKWAEEFQEYARIDPKEYEVHMDTSISLSDGMNSQYDIASQQKLAALLQVGDISAMVAETGTFEQYAHFRYFYNLEDFMSKEELEKYRPYFYYTDAAAFEPDADDAEYNPAAVPEDISKLTIDHRDPSTMEQPVAVGIVLTKDNLVADARLYAYLDNPQYDFQGCPADVVLGVPLTNKEPELAVRFLEYLQLGDH